MRVYRAIGRPDLADDPNYVDSVPRQEHGPEVDKLVAEWIAERTLDEAMAVLQAADVAASPVYDAQQLLADEHLQARGAFVSVDDADFGAVTVQAPVARMSVTPGAIDHLGRVLGADNDAVYGELLGLGSDRLAELRAAGVI
jgi:crotonobetainyl-CoA:carnitine CoA-transferase CaiB-like acyl-CoA transferase